MTVDVELTNPEDYGAGFPHEMFTRMRAEGAVHRHVDVPLRAGRAPLDFWSVVRHREVQQANRDWETFTATDSVAVQKMPEQTGTLVSIDPPQHGRLRRLITAGFTPRMIGRLDDHITTRTERILDEAAAQGSIDFVADVAYQLPMHVIADIVGIPDDERPWVFERTGVALRAAAPDSGLSPRDQARAAADLFGYAQQLTERKRRDPGDDVWTLIAQAEITDDDGTVHKLEGLELEMFFVILAIAGSETTRNALSHGLLALVDHGDQMDKLRDQPGLMTTAAEEILRWSSPALYFARTATRDTTLGGRDIAAGDRVVLWYPSANRDETVFEDPFRFDIHRDPNPHVTFGGGGPHYCLGASLARKEVQVLLTLLLQRFDVDVLGPPSWAGGGLLYNVGISVDTLPVRLRAR
jgi:cytochrome P450